MKLLRGKIQNTPPQLLSIPLTTCIKRTWESEGDRQRGRGGEGKRERILHPLLPYRVLQWSTFIDRTFCTETDDERRSWIEAINKVSKDLTKKQKEEAPSSSTASGGLKPTEGTASPKQGIKVREVNVGVAVQSLT